MPELFSDAASCCNRELGGVDVSDEGPCDQLVPVSVHDPLAIADLFADLAELTAEGEAFGDRVRGDDRGCTAVEGVRECCRVSRPARQLDRIHA